MLTSSTCEGPWEYSRQISPCYAFAENEDCGVLGINQCIGTCRHPNHGVDGTAFNYRYNYPSFRRCSFECSLTAGCRNVCTDICSNDNLAGLRAELDSKGWQNATYTVVSGDFCGKNLLVQNYRRQQSLHCGAAWCTQFRSCRTASNGLDTNRLACGTERVFSATGKTEAQIAATPNYVGTPAPRCFTCDQLPVSTALQVQQKYACLQDNYNAVLARPVSTDAQLAARILREWKLLFEMKGDLLTPAQQTHARTLYVQRTSPSLCGDEPTFAAFDANCSAVGPLLPKFAMCARMAQSHVPLSVLRLTLDECIDTVGQIANVPVSCNREAWSEQHALITRALIEKNFTDLSPMATVNRAPQFTERLRPIARWHDASAAVKDEKALTRRTSAMFAMVWRKAVLDEVASQPSATGSQAHAARTVALVEGLETDRELLLGAYTSPTALTGEPLLLLTGDALEGLHARLQTLAPFHDLACRFKSCAGVNTAVSQLWNLLAAVHDLAKLDAALAQATHPAVADWRLVFERIRGQHTALQAALNHAHAISGTYNPDLVLQRPIAQIDASALTLVRVVRDADARMRTFRAAGTFAPENPALRIGLEREKQLEIEQAVTAAISSLGSKVASLQQAEMQQVSVLQQQVRSGGSMVSLQNQYDQQLARLDDLLADLAGLQVTAAIDEGRFGDFMVGFDSLAPALEQAQQLRSVSMPPLMVRASDVSFVTGAQGALTDIGVRDLSGSVWRVQASKGELVNFRISGQWSPTCAVRETLAELQDNQTAQTDGTLTGPEGFMLTESEGRSVASAVENSRGTLMTETTTGGVTTCANASVGAEAFGNSATATVAACLSYELGRTHINNEVGSTTNATTIASTLAFSRGLRSESTPFPDAPVGSLLLVQVPRNATARANAVAVRVLQAPVSTVVVSDDADLYLVANEIAGCNNANDAMTVQVDRLVPMSGAEGQRIARLMAEATAELRVQASELVGQGRVLPTQLALLRSNVITSLESRCGCSVQSLPPLLMNLFEVFLNKELVHLERQVELVTIERSLRDVEMQVALIANDLQTAGAESRLLERSAALVLRDLDARILASQSDLLLEVMRDWVEPVIRLREPQTLASLAASDLTVLDALTDVGPTTELIDVASRAQQAAEAVHARLKVTRLSGPAPTEFDVAISFVKPGVPAEHQSLWHKADAARSAAVWQQLLTGQNPLVEVLPQDLISPTGPAVLPCANRAPIIKTMAVYIAMPSSVSLPVFNAQATLPPTFSFPTPENLVTLNFANADYLAPTVPILAGPPQQAVSQSFTFWSSPNRNFATGLSPFTSFALNVQSMNSAFLPPGPGQLHEGHPAFIGTELVMVFRVEPKPLANGVSLPGVPGCN